MVTITVKRNIKERTACVFDECKVDICEKLTNFNSKSLKIKSLDNLNRFDNLLEFVYQLQLYHKNRGADVEVVFKSLCDE